MRLKCFARRCWSFSRYVFTRMGDDKIFVNAGYMAYISLLSLVPLMTVLISVLSSFAAFETVGDQIKEYALTQFVPAVGTAVDNALDSFVVNAGKMSAFGGVFLFFAALMLISNIDKQLNVIWRVKQKRRWVYSFSMYWMVLTLGPIFLGASLVVSSYITSLKLIDNEALTGAYQLFLRAFPGILSFFAFVGLYTVVPNKKVKLSHAALGALVAALLFELSKKGFAFYITHFPSYQVIYGALAAIPILFIWVYLSWVIVMIGAEFTAALDEPSGWLEPEDWIESEQNLSVHKTEQNDSTHSKG